LSAFQINARKTDNLITRRSSDILWDTVYIGYLLQLWFQSCFCDLFIARCYASALYAMASVRLRVYHKPVSCKNGI